jgi:hypothetical protein
VVVVTQQDIAQNGTGPALVDRQSEAPNVVLVKFF